MSDVRILHRSNLLAAALLAAALAVCPSDAVGQRPPITALAFAPDGRSLVCASQAGLQVLHWPSLKPSRRLAPPDVNLHDLAFAPGRDRLAVAGGTPSESGTVTILAWPKLDVLQTLAGHTDSVMAVVWLDQGHVAAGALDHAIGVFDTTTGKRTATLSGHSRGVRGLCVLGQQQMLVSSGMDSSLRVWKPDGRKSPLARSLNQHIRPVRAVRLRPANSGLPLVASISEDRTVRFWQPTIGRMVRFARLTSRPLDAAWLPDGSGVAISCVDGHVRIVDPATVRVTHDVTGVARWAHAITVHPSDGSVAVGGHNGEVKRIRFRGAVAP